MGYHVGLDLGQAGDHTALAVVEDGRTNLSLGHLERYPLGTSYVEVVGSVAKLLARPELRPDGREGPTLIVDETGLGRPPALRRAPSG